VRYVRRVPWSVVLPRWLARRVEVAGQDGKAV
jgi:hypothetical protein